MILILKLFQIKSIRSARVFLFGSGLLFFFGVYQLIVNIKSLAEIQIKHFEITFFLFWFLICMAYIIIACWALFNKKGKAYLESQEKITINSNKNILWYFKFLFACYAASFATLILLGVVALPFSGTAGFEVMFSPNRGVYFLVSGLIWSPLIFRYLK